MTALDGPGVVEVTIPGLRLANPLNGDRRYWAVIARERRMVRLAVGTYLRQQQAPPLPCVVQIVRLGKRRMDDDGIRGACKSVRDAIAEWLGADDGSPLISWRYAQGKGEYGVLVRAATASQAEVDAANKAEVWA